MCLILNHYLVIGLPLLCLRSESPYVWMSVTLSVSWSWFLSLVQPVAVFFFFSQTICLSLGICLSIGVCFRLSLSLGVCLYLSLCICLWSSVCVYLFLCFSWYIYVSGCFSGCLFLPLSVLLSQSVFNSSLFPLGISSGFLGTNDNEVGNDYLLPNGSQAQNMDEFTQGWNVSSTFFSLSYIACGSGRWK